jgi:hypothetical protein
MAVEDFPQQSRMSEGSYDDDSELTVSNYEDSIASGWAIIVIYRRLQASRTGATPPDGIK